MAQSKINHELDAAFSAYNSPGMFQSLSHEKLPYKKKPLKTYSNF